jgi:hypothetical protein
MSSLGNFLFEEKLGKLLLVTGTAVQTSQLAHAQKESRPIAEAGSAQRNLMRRLRYAKDAF